VKKVYRNKGSKDNMVISIAGAHGVGKSTVFQLLKKKNTNNLKFKFFPERYVKNPPFPFGSSNKQIAFRSELHFLQQLIKRNQYIINYDEIYNGRIIILDRTPTCVLVYSKSLNLMEKDYKLILDTYNSVKWREDYVIYLSAEPEMILKRIIQRGSLEKIRKEWNEYEKEYLLKILSYYNQLVLSKKEKDKVIILNTEIFTPEQVVLKMESIISKLTNYSFKKQIKHPSTQMGIEDFWYFGVPVSFCSC
jgi:deoxyadenosine/deoxycytidine kinase